MTDRDTRPLRQRTKFMLGAIGAFLNVFTLVVGAWMKADSGAIIATVSGITAICSVTTIMQGRSDPKGAS